MKKWPHVGVGYQKTEDSDTSLDAALSVASKVGNQRRRTWEYVHAQRGNGSTAQEANEALGIKHNCCSRFTELRQLGRIERTGSTRPTETGRQADVHVAVEKAFWLDTRPDWPSPTQSQGSKGELERLREENQRLKKWIKDNAPLFGEEP